MSLKLYFIEIVAVACKKRKHGPPENQSYIYIIRIHAHYNYIHDTMADDWLWLHCNYSSDIDKREVPPLPLNPISCIYFRFIIIISDAMWVWKTTNKRHLYTMFRTVDTTRIRCVKYNSDRWNVENCLKNHHHPSPFPCHTKTNTRLVFVEFRMQPGHSARCWPISMALHSFAPQFEFERSHGIHHGSSRVYLGDSKGTQIRLMCIPFHPPASPTSTWLKTQSNKWQMKHCCISVFCSKYTK